MIRITKSAGLLMLLVLAVFCETAYSQMLENAKKGLGNSKKMFLDGVEPMDAVIGFILDMIEMGTGFVEMAMSIGRKKRSTLGEILIGDRGSRMKLDIPTVQ